ncbi:hypothetical protein L2E82_17761 [Cichorium intybus]|uniref:Uncharacterized protein n=1 Tax=Cichorium intybus TaxID=13427 RepID=A0ACB9F8W7_CICIN|nr:hypothetical protein L2E82_17761 [Cichorium intybus]
MGNRSCNQQVHHHPNTGTTTRTTKTFFPKLCRLSINDVTKPTRLADLSSSSSSISSSPDPSSPKISCIGQIKKRSNTTTTHYQPTTSRITTSKSATNLNYTKLRRLFSGKNLISPPMESAKISNHNGKCISDRNRRCNGGITTRNSKKKKKKHMISIGDPDVVVEELDPPLPVVKFQPRDQQVNVSLGKRRGIELKVLQIQPFHLSTVRSTKIVDNRDMSPDQQHLSIR